MIFGSRDPKTLDPYPYIVPENDALGRISDHGREIWPHLKVVVSPRQEAEWREEWMPAGMPARTTLTHGHNPILAAFRAYCTEYRFSPVRPVADQWLFAFASFDTFGGFDLWEHPKNTYHSLTVATPDQIEHARAVLTRLAGWQS